MEIKILVSKSGLPCLWESGGAWTNTGKVQIIAGAGSQPKKPIYVRRKGSLACGNHALIPVHEGDVVIQASQHRGDFTVEVCRISSVKLDAIEPLAILEQIGIFDEGEWDGCLPPELQNAVSAAQAKATKYHCRSPYYVTAESA